MEHFGIKEPYLDNLVKFIGPPLKESFQEIYGFDEGAANTAIKKYREYFSKKGVIENNIYPFIPELLEKLFNINKTLIVATSKPTVFAEKILAHFNIQRYFSLIVGSNLDGSRTQKKEVIDYALNRRGIVVDGSVVMIGDRKHDIIGAKEIGVDSIGVLYGYGSYEELMEHNPTHIVDSVIGLEKILI